MATTVTTELRLDRVTMRYLPPPRPIRPLVRVASKQPVDAVTDVSFQVLSGEIVGLVGPNGAGKTTLIRMIAGLLTPTSGEITRNGAVVGDSTPAEHLGLILDGDRGLYGRLTGHQNLEFFGVMSGMPRQEARQSADQLMAAFELAGRDKLVFGYSAGMKVRLSIARALMAQPGLLVLDEPTRSLDPVAGRHIGNLLQQFASDGAAVLLSSHRLDEVVEVCDRIVALVDGAVRFDGSPGDLGTDASRVTALAALLAAPAE